MADPRISLTRGSEVVLLWPAEAHPVDEMVDCYVQWRECATAAATAYQQWSDAPRDEKNRRYSAYTAWLDQEQATARSYELAVAEVEHWLQRTRW
jgi:hypothetical protein